MVDPAYSIPVRFCFVLLYYYLSLFVFAVSLFLITFIITSPTCILFILLQLPVYLSACSTTPVYSWGHYRLSHPQVQNA